MPAPLIWRRAFCTLWILLLLMPLAVRADDAVVDITMRCKFLLSSQAGQEAKLFDSDAQTYWKSEKHTESYVQFVKPFGAATLNLLWYEWPERITLEWCVDGEGAALQIYDVGNSHGDVSWIPDTILLPENAGIYRLRADGEMVISELRIHMGLRESFFGEHGYPDSPVSSGHGAPYIKPIPRNARVSKKVREMQQRLIELGYYAGKDTGTIDDSTYIALLCFQRANGLYPSGVYEPATAHVLQDSRAVPSQAASPTGEKIPRSTSAFIAYLQERIGAGYVFGSDGQISSPLVRGAAARLFPEYGALLKGYARRWDGLEVFDCSGLMRGFLEASDGTFFEQWQTNVNGATTQWTRKVEPIETMPRQPGILLLQEHPTIPGNFIHIGAYVGNGQSIHSRGHRYGVVMEPMPQLWTHWASPIWWLDNDVPEEIKTPWAEYMGVGTRVIVDSADGNAICLYNRPDKNAKYRTRVRLPNYSELRIEAVPEEHYWRIVTMPDEKGNLVTGYVFARDLSLIE